MNATRLRERDRRADRVRVRRPRVAAGRSSRVVVEAVLVAAGAAFGAVTSTLKATAGGPGHPWWDTALSATSGFLFLFAGLLGALRRPESRTGLLMILTGIAVFAEDLQFATEPVWHTLGLLLTGASTGVLAHLVLAFPSGVLAGRGARGLVAAAYAWSFVVTPVTVFFYASPPNLLFAADRPWVRDVGAALSVPIAMAVVGMLLARWRAGRPGLRHVLTPVLVVSLLGAVASLGAAAFWASDLGLYRAFVIIYQLTACLLPLAFLIGLLRIRLGRSAVSRLVEALSEPESDLRSLLSRALGDPDLLVAYPRADGSGLVDGNGETVDPSLGDRRRVATDVVNGGRTVAVLLHDPALVDDEHVLRAVTAAAGLALENERLNAELRAQLGEVRRSRRRIVAAQEAERRRLERDLHDGVQASLVASLISLRTRTESAADPVLSRAEVALQRALDDLRRISHGIRPAVLAEAGLEPALRELLAGSGLVTSLRVEPVPDELAETIFFVVSEAVSNVLKHAGAGRVDVAVERSANGVAVTVRDDGGGGARVREHGGLEGLSDRVQAVGGTVRLDSADGSGTVLRADFWTAG